MCESTRHARDVHRHRSVLENRKMVRLDDVRQVPGIAGSAGVRSMPRLVTRSPSELRQQGRVPRPFVALLDNLVPIACCSYCPVHVHCVDAGIGDDGHVHDVPYLGKGSMLCEITRAQASKAVACRLTGSHRNVDIVSRSYLHTTHSPVARSLLTRYRLSEVDTELKRLSRQEQYLSHAVRPIEPLAGA